MSEMRSRPDPPDVRLPKAIDVRSAFDVYVSGRSRNLNPEEKREASERASARASDGSPERAPPAGAGRGSIPVPERSDMRYDRNAGLWRDGAAADGGG